METKELNSYKRSMSSFFRFMGCNTSSHRAPSKARGKSRHVEDTVLDEFEDDDFNNSTNNYDKTKSYKNVQKQIKNTNSCFNNNSSHKAHDAEKNKVSTNMTISNLTTQKGSTTDTNQRNDFSNVPHDVFKSHSHVTSNSYNHDQTVQDRNTRNSLHNHHMVNKPINKTNMTSIHKISGRLLNY